MSSRLVNNRSGLGGVIKGQARFPGGLGLMVLVTALYGCTADEICGPAGFTSCLSCAADTADCNRSSDDGCEVSTLTDPRHCGRCDKICPGVSQQRGLCLHGVCSLCPAGRLDCNGLGEDGCETKSSSDPQNCGQCGLVCPAVRNGVAGCINQNCTIGRCQQGFEDCNGNPLDGCETDARTDIENCGGCGVTCDLIRNPQSVCVSGICETS